MAFSVVKSRFQAAACGALVAFGLAMPVAVSAETLGDALVSAYNHSGLLEQNRAVLRAADEDVALAGAALLPTIRWTGNVTQNLGRVQGDSSSFHVSNENINVSISVIGELLLYDFGASQYTIDATKETVLATRSNLISVEQGVLFRAVEAYMGVIEARETVALRNNNVSLLKEELRAARDRFEVGEVTRTDVALAEAQLAQARSGQAGAEGTLLRATEEFRNVIGRKPGRLKTPPRVPQVGKSLSADKKIAVRRHPDMHAAQHQVAAADLLVKSGEAAMNPRVTLEGSVGLSETFDSTQSRRIGSVGVRVDQTIYQGGSLSAQVRKAMAQRDAQRGNLHVVRHNIQQGVGNAYASLISARAQLDASERQIRAARIAFRGVREEATLGARTTLDVLDAEQSLLDAESTRVTARANLYIAAYAVLAAKGQLTAKALKLPVRTYDPEAYYNLVKDSPAKRSKEGEKLDRVLRALQKD